jgi:2'-5'-oligoadenylate synthetase
VDLRVSFLIPQCNKVPKGRGPLPPQHGLELLTVYAWEQGSRDPQFSMATGFRTVLELVTQYRQLCVYWTVNYSTEDETVRDFLKLQLQKPRSVPSPPCPLGSQSLTARVSLALLFLVTERRQAGPRSRTQFLS